MFDLGWIELFFCAALALIVVGPKDMPKLMKFLANGFRYCRRIYADIHASVGKLEKEVDLVSGKQDDAMNWQS